MERIKDKLVNSITPNEIITEETIKLLKIVLGTPEKYLHHLSILKTARDLVRDQIEDVPGAIKENKLFPLFDTLNELYGILWDLRAIQTCNEYMMAKKHSMNVIEVLNEN